MALTGEGMRYTKQLWGKALRYAINNDELS